MRLWEFYKNAKKLRNISDLSFQHNHNVQRKHFSGIEQTFVLVSKEVDGKE